MSDPKPVTPAMRLLSAALIQVDQVLNKANETMETIQAQHNEVARRQIELNAQRQMLVEIKNRLEIIETETATVDAPVIDVPATTPAATNESK